MTFENFEEGRFSGEPIDLFFFRYGEGTTDYYAYTNAVRAIVFDDGLGLGPISYEPLPINRDSVKSSGTLDKSAFKVTAPRDIPLADLFRVYPPSYVVTLVIRQGHISDPDQDYKVAWTGRILGYERVGSEVVLTCEMASTSMRRTGLRRHYQFSCPHLLYGEDCGADQVAATVAAEVASVSGLTVTFVDGWAAKPLIKYRQGIVRWTNLEGRTEIRQVLGVTEPNTLRLNGLLRDLTAGVIAQVSLGCNHQTSPIGVGDGDCTNLHNNGPNFGGCKWIPTKNPVGSSNRFY